MEAFFSFLTHVDEFFWGYVAFVLIMVLGTYLTVRTHFLPIRQFPKIVKDFWGLLRFSGGERGVHPLKAFFASVGGMIGIGNVVGIATAVQMGGPGALFWVWMAGMIGAIVKYGEIYLGLKYRRENDHGGYDGGPMYYLRQAFKSRWIPVVAALLLCIYGVEIYQFSVITESVSSNWGLNRLFVMGGLLALVLYASFGGVKRIGKICSFVMPFFMVAYLGMAFWVVLCELPSLPGILLSVFKSAFTGHAAVGGFVGSSMILAVQHGIARAAYSGDIGIGYDAIIQSESNTSQPERQAGLAVLGVFVDNFVCTMSILVVLVSGIWKATTPLQGSQLVQEALSNYFPFMHLFMPFFLSVVGYTTLIAFFCVGLKCARYLAPRWGTRLFALYGASAFVLFSFVDQSKALLIMSLAGSMLLILNLLGIFRLRHEFLESGEEQPALTAEV